MKLIQLSISLFFICQLAWAQDSTKIIVPWSPGGGVDIAARLLQPVLSSQLSQTIVVENRAGAGGKIGHALVSKFNPDQQILCMTSMSVVISTVLKNPPPYELKNIIPIIYLRQPLTLLVSPKLNIKNLKDLQQYQTTRPLTIGVHGYGSATHIITEQLSKNTKIPMTAVPFKGGTEILQALVGGHIDMGFLSYPQALPLMQDQKLIPLTIDLPQRHRDWPTLSTFSEFQLSQVADLSNIVLLSNQVTDYNKILQIQKALEQSFQDQNLVDKFEKAGFVIDRSRLNLPANFLINEQNRMTKIIDELNLKNLTVD
jgi:tripartite-type tricarboxylate transporter receptor subunit TctC